MLGLHKQSQTSAGSFYASLKRIGITAYPLSLVRNMIAELDRVILTTNIPKYGLEKGDMGTVVLVHQGGEGYEVEFVTLDGETVAIVSLFAAQVRPISSREIAHARVIN